MTKSKKIRRNSGRYVPRYSFNLPFDVREELDLHEERVMWDDWNDYRDGMRRGSRFKDILSFNRMMKRTQQFINKKYWRKSKE